MWIGLGASCQVQARRILRRILVKVEGNFSLVKKVPCVGNFGIISF